MEDILKADIFFFIASVGFVMMIIIFAILAYGVYTLIEAIQKLVNTIQGIAKRVEKQTEDLNQDVDNLRSFMYKGGIFAGLISLFNRK